MSVMAPAASRTTATTERRVAGETMGGRLFFEPARLRLVLRVLFLRCAMR